MAAPKEERMQFAFWLRVDLGRRFMQLVERKGKFQREVAEEAIERYVEAEEGRERDDKKG